MQDVTNPQERVVKRPGPTLWPTVEDWNPAEELRLRREKNPLPRGTLGDIGLYTRVVGPNEFPETILHLPFLIGDLEGVDAATIRLFRWDPRGRTLRPVWYSGINHQFGFVWAKIRRPGLYVPLGLPRDRLLMEVIRTMAFQRRYADRESQAQMRGITQAALELFVETKDEELDALRRMVAMAEIHPGLVGVQDPQIPSGVVAISIRSRCLAAEPSGSSGRSWRSSSRHRGVCPRKRSSSGPSSVTSEGRRTRCPVSCRPDGSRRTTSSPSRPTPGPSRGPSRFRGLD